MRDLRFSQHCYWDATPCRLVNIYQRYEDLGALIQCTGRLGRLLLSVGKNSAIVVSGFRREVEKNCVLLGHYAAGAGNSLPMFRDNLSVLSSSVFLFCFLTSEVGTETSVRNYHHPLHNDPEERSSHLLLGGNLKRRLLNFCRRVGADVLVFLYTGYKAPRPGKVGNCLPVDTVSHPINNTVRTSNLANYDIPFFV